MGKCRETSIVNKDRSFCLYKSNKITKHAYYNDYCRFVTKYIQEVAKSPCALKGAIRCMLAAICCIEPDGNML